MSSPRQDHGPGPHRVARSAPAWAETVLEVLATPYPWISGHVATGPDDCDVTPSRLHPAFHGSVDWHSSVHVQWSGVRLLALSGPAALPATTAQALRGVLDERLTAQHGEVEAAYLRARPSYERPYGWAWAAMLAAEVAGSGTTSWDAALRPVADTVAEHLLAWLPRLAYPVRHGVHASTAFALVLAHDAFGRLGRDDVVELVEDRARSWYAGDRDAPVRWEPSGEDFLSPSLVEAELLRRVLPVDEYDAWLAGFLPDLAAPGDPLLEVPRVLDDRDGKAVHLHGLALSRAWLLRTLAPHLDPERRTRALASATTLVDAVAPQIVTGDLMSTHWLVSFALLADGALGDG